MSAGSLEALAEHRIRNRPAHAVRLRADECRNRRQRRRLALAPPDVPAGRDTHQQRILAAVRLVGDLGHGEIEKIDGFDVHEPSVLAEFADAQLMRTEE